MKRKIPLSEEIGLVPATTERRARLEEQRKARQHRAWCAHQARRCIEQAKHKVGLACWEMFGDDFREAFTAREVLACIAGQENGELPLHRMQQLIRETLRQLNPGVFGQPAGPRTDCPHDCGTRGGVCELCGREL